jgi:hypothetical protein
MRQYATNKVMTLSSHVHNFHDRMMLYYIAVYTYFIILFYYFIGKKKYNEISEQG